MSPNQETSLIDHFDNHLKGIASPELEQLLAQDPEAVQEWARLQLAVEGIKELGLYEQVGAVRRTWQQQQETATPSIVRRLSHGYFRAAAVIAIVAFSGIAVYKYTTTSAAGVYAENYISFQSGTQRGTGMADDVRQAYQEKNWAGVIEAFKHAAVHNNENLFLTGMANLELKRYAEAAVLFQQVIDNNAKAHDTLFEEDAEYYLAMTQLAANHAKEAMPLIDRIKADPHHAYHDQVKKIPSIDLWIARHK